MFIRSISGLRGTVGTDDCGLTVEVVTRYAASFASYCGNKSTIVLGYDGRAGGKLFYELCQSALLLSGCNVLALGMVPTPTVQMATEHGEDVMGGIAITASHNPGEWNGMKFIAMTGMFLDAEENREFWEIVDEKSYTCVPVGSFGMLLDGTPEVEAHIEAVLSIPSVDIGKIRSKKFRIVLDAVNASGSRTHTELLRRLGVEEIIPFACDGSGIFPHTPEPVPQNLTSLKEAVLREKADCAIVVDPDADRLVLIMENGEPFIEENTIALATEQVLKHSPKGQTVVVNLSTTRAVEDIAAQYDAAVVRTPVGEINVAKRMKELGAIVGGEGSGGVILPSVHLGRDSLVGIALTLTALAEFNGTISEKRKSMPQYHIEKSKLELKSEKETSDILLRLESHFGSRAVTTNLEDGVRFDFSKSWLHARPSNTEPIVRLIAEAPTEAEAKALLKEAHGQV